MTLEPWGDRWATEQANHFNPAYCGALIYEFVRSYERAKHRPVSFALLFCALPIALHPGTRDRLPSRTNTGMFPWLENNCDVKVGFGTRARNLAPYIREAVRYAAAREALRFVDGGLVKLGPKRASFTQAAFDETTTEVRNTVNAVRMIARWFASTGDTASILSGWGVRV